jgi:hypothetical protein
MEVLTGRHRRAAEPAECHSLAFPARRFEDIRRVTDQIVRHLREPN